MMVTFPQAVTCGRIPAVRVVTDVTCLCRLFLSESHRGSMESRAKHRVTAILISTMLAGPHLP